MPFMDTAIRVLYIFLVSIYLFAGLAVSIMATTEGKDVRYLPLVFAGMIATHFVYGVHFLHGLAVWDLER